MKWITYILFIYLMALTTLPSVRAIKMFVSQEFQNTCHNAEESNSGCEKGKAIMNLKFSPSQFVTEISLKEIILISDFYTEKEQSSYEKIFISKYQQSIWHPPKFFI
jgi:capsular polysaccharide biosynthesis protein